MIIEDYKPFLGQHCETTATGNLLSQIGIELSEPMIFGLGEGLGFIFWKMKTMDFPFLGGRVKTDLLTENVCRNLNLRLDVTETTSKAKAWKRVAEKIEEGVAVGLKLDCYYLEYFTSKIHFAGHYVAMYGFDEKFAYLVDTAQQGGLVKTSLDNLQLARSEKGPMSSNNLSFTIEQQGTPIDLEQAVRVAIRNNAETFLNPPIKNLTYKGILKTSTEIKKWFNSTANIKSDFQTSAMLMERAGTGGSMFRNLYRDFLKESAGLLSSDLLADAHEEYVKIALKWKQVADAFHQAGETEDISHIHYASDLLIDIAEAERLTMSKLSALSSG